MDEPLLPRSWLYRLLLVALTCAIVFFHLLPIKVGSGSVPAPDLFIALLFAWVLRRPDYVPPLLVALVMLSLDMLFMRPPGLWAALTLIGVEFLRSREPFQRDQSFAVEWVMVSAVMTLMVVANRLILSIFVVEQAGFGLSLVQLAFTIVAYPLVVLVSQFLLGVTKIQPGELDSAGYRL